MRVEQTTLPEQREEESMDTGVSSSLQAVQPRVPASRVKPIIQEPDDSDIGNVVSFIEDMDLDPFKEIPPPGPCGTPLPLTVAVVPDTTEAFKPQVLHRADIGYTSDKDDDKMEELNRGTAPDLIFPDNKLKK
jgi:hypothetical protein